MVTYQPGDRPTPPPKPESSGLRAPALLLIVGLVAVFGLFIWLGGDDERGESDAEVMCQEYVKDRLRSPASADFSRTTAESTGEQEWSVTGTVDSQNGFGAVLRSSFECEVSYEGDDEWSGRVVSLVES